MKILGIDEVGRGPVAGPLVVGAVVLPPREEWDKYSWIEDLRDSKKIGKTKRRNLSEKIWAEAPAAALGWVEHDELDTLGIDDALTEAMSRAIRKIQGFHAGFSQIVIDGNRNYLEGTSLSKFVTTVVKGDDIIKEVSAASIIAKVARDDYMIELGEEYPEYGFERHMGYGTPEHREAIEIYGLCPEHRLSFEPCRTISGFKKPKKKKKKNTTEIGKHAEEVVASYLESMGHMIVARNFKNKYCEIDIVSVDFTLGKVYFTEVKYRKDGRHGGGFAAVDKGKQKQMKFAVELFLAKHKEVGNLDPVLTAASVEGPDFVVQDWVELY